MDIARGAAARDRAARTSALGGGVALNGWPTRASSRESGFERLFVPPAPGRRRLRARRGALRGPHPLRQPDRRFPDHPFWGPAVEAGDLARIAARTGWRSRRLTTPSSSRASPTNWPPARSWAGWTAPRSSGRARSATAASWPRRIRRETRDRLNRDIKYREEFRPFAPVVPEELAEEYFELPPGGARLGAVHVRRVPGAAGVARARWRR